MGQREIMNLCDQYEFSTYNGMFQNDDLLKEMSALYSSHYGIWGGNHVNSGKQVRLSVKRIKQNFISDKTCTVTARKKDTKELIGYAIAIKTKFRNKNISWVIQFVVHSQHRNRKIGITLLYSLWGESHFDAWGIVTANPYAVRALEKATHRRCDISKIKRYHCELMVFAQKEISYISQETKLIIDDKRSVINTEFFVDHSQIEQKINDVASQENPWILGKLEDGFEWFAFTFKTQKLFPLSPEEISLMLNTSDEITKEAYSRMFLTKHAWTKYSNREVEWILNRTKLQAHSKVLDLGCGNGRHSIELSKRGYIVTAIDYINFDNWHKEYPQIEFKQRDIRDIKKDSLDKNYDLIICLYDVIGTYADNENNAKIIKEIYDHLKPGGYAVISVMNLDYVLAHNPRMEDLYNNWDALLNLLPENSMQKSGNIFDATKIIVDKNTLVCYRKEQFEGSPQKLFNEFIVRDKRYKKEEIISLLKDKGFEIIECRYVLAEKWDQVFLADQGKEILILCRKGFSEAQRSDMFSPKLTFHGHNKKSG